jgi:hypothetical protein
LECEEKEKDGPNLHKIYRKDEESIPYIVDYEEGQSVLQVPERLAYKMESTDPTGAVSDPRVSKMAPAPETLMIQEEPNSCKREVSASAPLNSSDESLQVSTVPGTW